MRFSPCLARFAYPSHGCLNTPLIPIPPKSSDEGGWLHGKRVLAVLGEDFKKEHKELYQPKSASIVDVPEMIFIMVDGTGDPNVSEAYKTAMEILYGLSYAIKMSKKGGKVPVGYFDYVVPPLEGFWWIADSMVTDFSKKEKYCWTSMIRQPEFVTSDVFEDAKAVVSRKKPGLDLSVSRLTRITEGLCAQIMHIGPYDEEPKTIELLDRFIAESGYQDDTSGTRCHHEIYLNNPLKTAPDKLKTVIRRPVKRIDPFGN